MKKEELRLQEEIAEAEAKEEALAMASQAGSCSGAAHVKLKTATVTQPQAQAVAPAVLTHATVDQPPQTEKDEVIKKLLTASLLPKPDIPVFSGDLTRFGQFLRAFDNRVGNIVKDQDSKIQYLEQFTSGVPRDIVRSCMQMVANGYTKARSLLEKKYGDPEKIGDSFINKLMNWPTVKADDVATLENFALELQTCANAVGSLKQGMHELDNPKTLRKLLEKLPFTLQERWRREVDNVKVKFSRSVSFSDLVRFVEVEARIASNSSFGRQMFQRSTNPRKKEKNAKVNFVRQGGVSMNKPPSPCCGEVHMLENCTVYPQRPLDARRELIREKRLCFGCLKPGHRSRECRGRLTCKVCGKMHPSVLHIFQAVSGGVSPASAVVSVTSNIETSTRMPAIPVKVRCGDGPVVQTYGFIDSGNSLSFCSHDLLSQLGVKKPKQTRLTLTTMAREPVQLHTSAVSGLQLCDLDENERIYLPEVFALDKIPVSKAELCSVAPRLRPRT